MQTATGSSKKATIRIIHAREAGKLTEDENTTLEAEMLKIQRINSPTVGKYISHHILQVTYFVLHITANIFHISYHNQ